jgi:gliding motility-associated-like protein
MNKIYFTLLLAITFNFSWAQGENCSGAVALTNGACVAGTAGLTQNIVGCVGNADDDAWYKFVATGTSHSITVTGSATYDAVLQVFSGTCSALISNGCVDNSLNGQSESLVASGLTIGTTYYVRVYNYGVGSGSSTFTMCLANPPAAPSNDACAAAINIPVNAGCINTAGTSFGATQSLAPCAGTANDDVWYSFAATNYTQTIQVAGSASMDPVVELYDGACGTLTSLSCTDVTFSGGTETVSASGLTPGVTYYFRVYDYYSTAGNTFSVCVSGTSILAGSQPNDEPCNAIQIPAVTADCMNLTFSNVGATSSAIPGGPAAICENYNNATNSYGAPTSGGFGAASKDVWFKITVPASGNIYISPTPNMGAGWIQDGIMALYRGPCGALTSYTCSDDYNYPAGYNDLQPFLQAKALTPGEIVYLRYWGYGSAGNFGFCVQSPTNDVCANALYICDINGYSATTSRAYTPDWPCNMKGDAETTWNAVTQSYNFAPGNTPSGGPFGLGGTWGVGQPYPTPPYPSAYDVQIDNNSWVRFTAASPTVTLRVTVSDCWGTGTNSVTGTPGAPKGVQMQIFSTSSACCGFIPVSDYKENASGSFVGGISTYTLNANSLTIGNDYYVMVDGWGGDICNYNIQALSGVALPAITAVPGTICPGQSTILTAPSGATGYTWAPTGETTQTISVSPGTQMTYSCFVGGVCGFKQTLTKTVFLYATVPVSINAGAAISNCGTQTITLTGSGASTYSWSTGNTTTSFTIAPSSNTSYSLTGTDVNGCKNLAVTNVTVTTFTIVPAGTNTICNGASTSLTVSGANTYTWSPAATLSASTGTIVTATPTIGTNYTIIGTGPNSCTNSATYFVTVNPKPTVSSTTTNSILCNGGSTILSGSGTANTYTWTGGVTDGVAFTPTNTVTYTVTGTFTATGCTNTSVRTITVNSIPTVSSTVSNSVICSGFSTTLNGGGASTYTWTGGVTNGTAFSPTTTTTYTVSGTSVLGCTNTAVRTITVNPLPTVSSTVSNSVICNGGSTTLNGSGTASSFTWTGGVTNGVAFSPAATTTYTVTGTDGNGCINTSVRTVTVNPIPTSTTSTTGTITCATNTVNLNTTAVAGASYTWTAPGGSSINGGTANNQNAIGQGAGTYTLNISASSCTYSTTLATNVNMTAPVATATGGTLTCAQTSTTLVGGPTSGVTYSWSGPGISGSTTSANATATTVGTYSLITTSTLTGCSNSVAAVATVTNNLTTPTVSAGSNQIITCAIPSVTLTGSATAGSNLLWSNGATTNTTTVGGSGTYTLTATNPTSGCFTISTVQVLPSVGTPTGSIGSVTNSITCTNTSVAVSITTTVSPITYSWTGPGTIASPTSSATTVSSGGTYTITITNTASCSQSYPVVVPTNTTPVVASASVAPSSSITCSTTSITLGSTPTGTNYAYAWTGTNILSGATSANPIVGAGGNYTVMITNTINGCSGTTGTATVFVPTNTTVPTLSLSATSVITTCGNPSTTVTATSNSNPNTTYTWTAPATGTIGSTSVSNPSIGGSGVFTVAITNTINGCPSLPLTVSVTKDINIPTFTLSANSTTVNCTTPAPTITITTSPSGLTYSWSPNPNSGGTTASPTFTAASNYTCVVTNTANGCSTNVPVVAVSIDNIIPTATATGASSITCSSPSITLSSTVTPLSNINYNWTGPGVLFGGSTLSPTIGLGGDYVIAMTNTVNGCVGNYTVTVPSDTTVPTMSLSTYAYTTTCSAPSVVITATSSSDPNTTYSWTAPGTGTISSASVSNPSVGGSGVFTVVATNTVNGCISALGTVSITADANIPTFTLPNNSTTITCANPTPSVSLTSTVTNITYSWNPTPSSGATTASPTFTATGNYTCIITNTVNNCSTNLPQVTVGIDTISPILNVTPSVSITCSPNPVVITSTVNTTSTYTWSGTGIQGSVNGSSITVNSVGNYSLTITNPVNGCTNTATSSVGTNTTAPTLSISPTSTVITCSVNNSTLTATSTLTDSIIWTIPGGGAATNSVVATAAGDYTATIVDAINGCSTSQTITIASNITPPDANAGASVIMPCSLPTAILSGTSTTTDAVSYNWFGTNTSSITSGSNTPTPTVNSVGIYTLMVTNLVTGCTKTATVNVTKDNVVALFTADPTTGEAPLTINFTNGSIGASNYNWNFGNGGTSTNINPNTIFNTAGTYTVVLIASSTSCSDTTAKTIIVEDGFTIEIPNVFTPNGDAINDAFHIKITGVKSAEGYIYNRWGQLLHSWDALNVAWDGKGSNGENCPDATYYYLIKVIDKKGKEHIAPGYVLIVR